MAEVTFDELERINTYAQTKLAAEDVFTFGVILCNDQPDRDNERFSKSALEKLAELFVGKTGIFDHDPKGRSQTARIFDCAVETDPETGESRLRAKAYMVRTAGNADLIAEIKGGIKKEVSVSCSVAKKICSVCGADVFTDPCMHIKGQEYGGEVCVHILDEPTDAYEWSFVAVPAQRGAGVTKSHTDESAVGGGGEFAQEDMKLREEILRLSYFCKPFISGEAVAAMTGQMNTHQLRSLRRRLRKAMLEDEQRLYAEERSMIPRAESNTDFMIGSD